jgi:site-specific recombinase XerD
MANLKVIYTDELVLLKRNQSPIIYARAKVNKRWINISTKTKNIEEAQQFAVKWHAELQFKEKYNIPIHERSVDTVCDAFLKHMKDSHNYNDENIKDYGSTLERYIRPFFGDKAITQITLEMLKAFASWRNSYWTEGPGAKLKFIEYKRGGKLIRRPVPESYRKAPKRLSLEEIVLRKLFNLAAERGWMQVAQIPLVKLEVTSKTRRDKGKNSRRPAFTKGQYKKILDELSGKNDSSMEATDIRDLYLYAFIVLLFTTGLRPGREIDSITWRGIERYLSDASENSDDPVKRVRIHLEHSKTKAIPVVVNKRGVEALQMVRRYYKAYAKRHKMEQTSPKLDDLVFTLPTGQWLHSNYFLRRFQKRLDGIDLLKDRYGNNYTLYSCRHSFASWLLQDRKIDVYSLAILMRTSILMVEKFYGQVEPEHLAHLLDE